MSAKNIVFQLNNQLVEFYKNSSVVNYLTCICGDFILGVTTVIFVFYFNCFYLQSKNNQ